jgi:hypothetical protein
MQYLALLMIVTVTTVEYLAHGDKWGRVHVLPAQLSFLPELLGAVALVCVIALGMQNRFKFLRHAYWIVFGLLGFALVAGVIVNGVESGPIFAGIRNYFRAIPWFFVPAVFAFSEKQVRTQLRVLLAICVLQVPVAIEQRIYTTNTYYGFEAVTGDWTIGTLNDSGVLSIFLVAAACVVVALTIRQSLTKWQGLLLFLLLLVPTMINETKATLVLLPFGILVTFLCASRPGARIKQLGVALGLSAVFLALFVPTYNKLNEKREYGVSIGEFFLNSGNAEQYLLSNADVGTTVLVNRGDAMIVAVRETLKDPVRAAFGLGMGNASLSALGKNFAGRFSELYKNFLVIGFARFILELGFLGFGLLLAVYWLIFQDARVVSRKGSGNKAALAAAWAGITVVMLLALFYTRVETSAPVSILFWYFSGLIAAERARLASPHAASEPVSAAESESFSARRAAA